MSSCQTTFENSGQKLKRPVAVNVGFVVKPSALKISIEAQKDSWVVDVIARIVTMHDGAIIIELKTLLVYQSNLTTTWFLGRMACALFANSQRGTSACAVIGELYASTMITSLD